MSRLLMGCVDAVRAPALPAQPSDCSPRTRGAQPTAVLRLALRPGGRFGRGAKPPSEWESGVPQDYVYAVALGVLLLFVWSQF